jgi:hypothetical protein
MLKKINTSDSHPIKVKSIPVLQHLQAFPLHALHFPKKPACLSKYKKCDKIEGLNDWKSYYTN